MRCSECKEVPLITQIEMKRGVCLMCNPELDNDSFSTSNYPQSKTPSQLDRIESKLDKLLEGRSSGTVRRKCGHSS